MLENIPYSTHSLGSLATLADALSKKARTNHLTDAMIQASTSNITSAVTMAQKAIGSSTGSSFTKEIREADDIRDRCYRGLRDHVVAGMERITNTAYKEACEKLNVVFEKNNTLLASLPYREETAALESLLADLKPMGEYLSQANASEWVQELQDANDRFKALLAVRSSETAKEEVPTDAEAKSAISDALRIFSATLDSLSAFGQPVGIAATITELNQIIIEANQAARK